MDPHYFVYKAIFDKCSEVLSSESFCKQLADEGLDRYKKGLLKKIDDLLKDSVKSAKKQAKLENSLKLNR